MRSSATTLLFDGKKKTPKDRSRDNQRVKSLHENRRIALVHTESIAILTPLERALDRLEQEQQPTPSRIRDTGYAQERNLARHSNGHTKKGLARFHPSTTAIMVGTHQPFLYEAEQSTSSFPEKTFDPKAVTRASWQAKPVKPKQEGPLVQFNRHPEYVLFVCHISFRSLISVFYCFLLLSSSCFPPLKRTSFVSVAPSRCILADLPKVPMKLSVVSASPSRP